ncbi:MAG: hypothetical protein RBS43_01900 [Candidatus Cloacimonas sp.]|nr:hypothetical protein [Candidatus Cloacimonas sp.]
MIRLEDIKAGALIQGLEPGEVVRIVTSEPIGLNALTVYYKKNDGSLLERLIYRIRNPYTQEPDWAVSSINLDVQSLLKQADNKEG